jgi:hypothetical protein
MNKYKFLCDRFINDGYKIFPIKHNSKEPLIERWQLDASCDKEQIMYWLEKGGEPNWALPAYANNLFIIDIDMHGDVDGISSFQRLLHDIGLERIDTLKQQTPSGGVHLIFKSDDELDCVKNASNVFDEYPGIDIRTKGYILIQPSIINGVPYELSGGVDKIKEIPQVLKDFILKYSKKVDINSVSQRSDFYEKGKKVSRGSRDDEIFTYLKYLYNNTKLGYDEIALLAHTYNEECFDPPLSKSVIDYKLRKLFETERREILIVKL